MATAATLKKGDYVQYQKEIMYKGRVTINAMIVAVIDRRTHKRMLLDNGDEFYTVKTK